MENGDYKNDPMKRLVYKHDVIVALAEKIDKPIDFVEALKNLPIVDAVKVRHGHWIEKNTNKDNTHNIYCSRCGGFIKSRGHAHSYYTRDKWAYCPNCGAKMDGGNDE